jgi:hypothetical protein
VSLSIYLFKKCAWHCAALSNSYHIRLFLISSNLLVYLQDLLHASEGFRKNLFTIKVIFVSCEGHILSWAVFCRSTGQLSICILSVYHRVHLRSISIRDIPRWLKMYCLCFGAVISMLLDTFACGWCFTRLKSSGEVRYNIWLFKSVWRCIT